MEREVELLLALTDSLEQAYVHEERTGFMVRRSPSAGIGR